MTQTEKLFDDNLDPEIVKIADRCVELEDQVKEITHKRNIQFSNLLGLMKKAGKHKIKHDGKTFEIVLQEAKEKIKIKDVSTDKK